MSTSARLPWYAYIVGALVLAVALAMSAPGEYQLARAAGWGEFVAAGMPICMSVYAVVAVWFTENRAKGEKGRGSAVAGAIGALGMTLTGQVVAHWIAAGYMTSSKELVAAVSAVPAIVAGHVAHMVIRSTRPVEAEAQQAVEDQDQGEAAVPVQPTLDGTEPPVDEVAKRRARRRPGRPAPSLEEIRQAAETLAAKGEEVTGPALAKVMGRDRRTGSRYLKKLNAKTA
jgi:MFS family permease